MVKSKNFFLTNFSHIYVENQANDYEITSYILKHYANSKIIRINHYKDIFSSKKQNFLIQKNSQKLILAVKRAPFIFKGPNLCQNFGNKDFYYTTPAINCVFNCSYCFLQGMYSNASILIFVNQQDYFENIIDIVKNRTCFISCSYETDLIGIDSIYPLSKLWIEFALKNPNITIELRTKSFKISQYLNISPIKNLIFSVTLSPQTIIEKFESGTPCLNHRLSAIKKLQDRGWFVRVCIDPILKISNFEDIYKSFIDELFSQLTLDKIHDISLGVFRMPNDYLKKIRKLRYKDEIIQFPYEVKNEVASYSEKDETYLINVVKNLLRIYIKEDKIFI